MIKVETDWKRNLMTVTYCGRVKPVEFEESKREMEGAIDQMTTGFRLLTDLGGLESMDVACAPFIDKIMDQINERGVSMVVRIVPDPKKDIGFRVMSYFHYDADVEIITCENMEEAERALAD